MGNSNGGKLQVVTAVLKMKGPFKVAHVTELSGLDRQLSYYHVNKLLEQGLLIRTGHAYSVRNHDELLDYLVETNDAPGLKLMEPEGIFSQKSADNLNTIVQGIVSAKVLGLTDSIDMTVHMNKIIDESMAELKTLKRYLNNAQPIKKKASTFFIKGGTLHNQEVWDSIVGDYDFLPTITKEDWQIEIRENEE